MADTANSIVEGIFGKDTFFDFVTFGLFNADDPAEDSVSDTEASFRLVPPASAAVPDERHEEVVDFEPQVVVNAATHLLYNAHVLNTRSLYDDLVREKLLSVPITGDVLSPEQQEQYDIFFNLKTLEVMFRSPDSVPIIIQAAQGDGVISDLEMAAMERVQPNTDWASMIQTSIAVMGDTPPSDDDGLTVAPEEGVDDATVTGDDPEGTESDTAPLSDPQSVVMTNLEAQNAAQRLAIAALRHPFMPDYIQNQFLSGDDVAFITSMDVNGDPIPEFLDREPLAISNLFLGLETDAPATDVDSQINADVYRNVRGYYQLNGSHGDGLQIRAAAFDEIGRDPEHPAWLALVPDEALRHEAEQAVLHNIHTLELYQSRYNDFDLPEEPVAEPAEEQADTIPSETLVVDAVALAQPAAPNQDSDFERPDNSDYSMAPIMVTPPDSIADFAAPSDSGIRMADTPPVFNGEFLRGDFNGAAGPLFSAGPDSPPDVSISQSDPDSIAAPVMPSDDFPTFAVPAPPFLLDVSDLEDHGVLIDTRPDTPLASIEASAPPAPLADIELSQDFSVATSPDDLPFEPVPAPEPEPEQGRAPPVYTAELSPQLETISHVVRESRDTLFGEGATFTDSQTGDSLSRPELYGRVGTAVAERMGIDPRRMAYGTEVNITQADFEQAGIVVTPAPGLEPLDHVQTPDAEEREPIRFQIEVRPGDSLERIMRREGFLAEDFGAATTEVATQNDLDDPNLIHPGQTITFQSGSQFYQPPSR